MSQADSRSQFAHALLEPERAAMVLALAARGFSRERLEKHAGRAKELVDRLGDKKRLVAAESTRLEAEAVLAQKQQWDACRRMIRQLVATADSELARLWAAC